MCLHNAFPSDSTYEREGYRVFRSRDGQLYTIFGDQPLARGVWLRSDEKRAPHTQHRDGFYGFYGIEGTKNWFMGQVVLKVRFRLIHTKGYCFGEPAFVAEQMFIPIDAVNL